jgi:hypothetical protein
MQQIPACGCKGYKNIGMYAVCNVKHPPIEKNHKDALKNKHDEHGKVEIECIAEPITQPVIYGKRRRHDRAIGLIGRQRADSCTVFEKKRDIADAADKNIINYGMGIIKLERIVKTV